MRQLTHVLVTDRESVISEAGASCIAAAESRPDSEYNNIMIISRLDLPTREVMLSTRRTVVTYKRLRDYVYLLD
jgi:hypothetical protein